MTIARFLTVSIIVLGALGTEPALAQKAATIGGTGRIQPAGGVLQLTNAGSKQQVERVLVREGDTVKKGDVLVVFSERPLREAERDATVQRLEVLDEQFKSREKVLLLERESAQNALAAARADLQAVEGLDERTVAARDRRARAQSVTSAEIAVRLVEARLADARQAIVHDRRQVRLQVDLARTQVSQTQLLAPGNGTVVELFARPGMMLAGNPALSLADTTTMYVNADFFEGDISRIAPGMRAKVTNSALGNPLPGVVERVGRIVDAGSRLAKVSIRLDQPAPADRYIGMQVDVSVDPSTAAK